MTQTESEQQVNALIEKYEMKEITLTDFSINIFNLAYSSTNYVGREKMREKIHDAVNCIDKSQIDKEAMQARIDDLLESYSRRRL